MSDTKLNYLTTAEFLETWTMLLNRSRLKSATLYLYKVDSYDVPARLAYARQNCSDALEKLIELAVAPEGKELFGDPCVRHGDEDDYGTDVEQADEIEQPRLQDLMKMFASGLQIRSWADTLLRFINRVQNQASARVRDLETVERSGEKEESQDETEVEQQDDGEEVINIEPYACVDLDKEEFETTLVEILSSAACYGETGDGSIPKSSSRINDNVEIICETGTRSEEGYANVHYPETETLYEDSSMLPRKNEELRANLAASFSAMRSSAGALDENHFRVHKFGLSNLQSWHGVPGETLSDVFAAAHEEEDDDQQFGPPVMNFSEPFFQVNHGEGALAGENEIGGDHIQQEHMGVGRTSHSHHELDVPPAEAEHTFTIHPRSLSDKDLSEMKTKLDLETSIYPSNLGFFSHCGVQTQAQHHADPQPQPRSILNRHPRSRDNYALSETFPSLRSLDLSRNPSTAPHSSSSHIRRPSSSSRGRSRNHFGNQFY